MPARHLVILVEQVAGEAASCDGEIPYVRPAHWQAVTMQARKILEQYRISFSSRVHNDHQTPVVLLTDHQLSKIICLPYSIPILALEDRKAFDSRNARLLS